MLVASTATFVGTVTVIVFVVAVLGWAAYALIRPFTHKRYTHPTDQIFKPLD